MTATDPKPSMHGAWGGHRFGYRANRFMLWLGTHALAVGYLGVAIGAVWFFVFNGKARRASADFLGRVHPSWSRPRRLLGAYVHMYRFGQMLLDRGVMLASDGKRFDIECEGREHLFAAAERGRGVLVLTAHFGMADLAAPMMRKVGDGRRVNVVMYQDAADATERFHARHRPALGCVRMINTADGIAAAIAMHGALRRNEIVSMRADRAMPGRRLGVRFFGQPVEFPAGPFLMAGATGAAVVCLLAVRTGMRRYRIKVLPMPAYEETSGPSRDGYAATAAQTYADQLEKIARAHPYQWANFFDFWGVQSAETSKTNVEMEPAGSSNSAS